MLEVTSLALRAPLHAATRRSGSAAAAAAKDELSHPAGDAGRRARDELMPARCRRTDGEGGGHADSVAHPLTTATLHPMPSREDGAQLQGSVRLRWWERDGNAPCSLPPGLHCLACDTKPSPGVLHSTSPRPIRVPSVCRAMTSPPWAGIPAFCCAELLTLSWCQMAPEADDFIPFKGARDLAAAPAGISACRPWW